MIYTLLAANALMLILLLISFRTLPPVLPLFYSRPAGELQLAEWWFVFLIPVLMNVLYFFNNIFVQRLFSDSEFSKKVIWYTNLVLVIGFTLIFIKVVTLIS